MKPSEISIGMTVHHIPTGCLGIVKQINNLNKTEPGYTNIMVCWTDGTTLSAFIMNLEKYHSRFYHD